MYILVIAAVMAIWGFKYSKTNKDINLIEKQVEALKVGLDAFNKEMNVFQKNLDVLGKDLGHRLDAMTKAQKFAKGFSSEQFDDIATQVNSMITLKKLVEAGDLEGVFKSYIKPEDWSSFVKDVYGNSVKPNMDFIKSLIHACLKIFGDEILYNLNALSMEATCIKTSGKSLTELDVIDSKINHKLTIEVDFTDHNLAVLKAEQLFEGLNERIEKGKEELVKESFDAFVSQNLPELHAELQLGLE